jgi:hypothetical protein
VENFHDALSLHEVIVGQHSQEVRIVAADSALFGL